MSAFRAAGERVSPAAYEGGKLLVPPELELPKICLGCGTEKKVKVRKLEFKVSGLGAFGYLISPLLSAMSPERYVRLQAGLCKRCFDRREASEIAVPALIVGAMVALIGIGTAAFNGAAWLGLVLACVWVGATFWAYRAFIRPQRLRVQRASEGKLAVSGLPSGVADAIVERLTVARHPGEEAP